MAQADPIDFGQCSCTGTYALNWVEVRFTAADGGVVSATDVPQGRCPKCGSRCYKAWELRVLEDRLRITLRGRAG